LTAQITHNSFSSGSASSSEGNIPATTTTTPPPAAPVVVASPPPTPTPPPASVVAPLAALSPRPADPIPPKVVDPPKVQPPAEIKVVAPVVSPVTTTVTLPPPRKNPPVEKHTEKVTAADGDKNANLLRTKLAALPEENKVVVEYLLNIFGKIVPQQWKVPANLELPSVEEQVEVTFEKLLEASEILFNKDHHAMLKRYTKEMNESPKRRVEKWKLLASILSQHSDFVDTFISSNAVEAAVKSAVSEPLDDDEGEVLLELLHTPLSIQVAHKDLLAVIKSSSHSNPHVTSSVNGVRSLVEYIVDLVASFKKQKLDDYDLHVPVVTEAARDKKEIDVAVGTNLSHALLSHATVITHAKTGNDLSVPLGKFFEEQISREERKGADLQEKSATHKTETEKNTEHMDAEIKHEQTKLSGVQSEIKDLEFKLVQKRSEEKALEELLAHQLEQRQKYKEEQEKAYLDISEHIAENKTQLSYHTGSLASVKKFTTDISDLLNREVDDTIKKTRDVLLELEKEVTFLEEKMASYERSFSLFNATDEPEVLEGLKKLFVRSAAIYVESKQSVTRVKSVVALLHTVIDGARGSEMHAVKEIESSLDKIIERQHALNEKYKLQKN
jgi:Skp family chaperone for outer membrane proteins